MKVILYLAQTVNGYIARENDDTPWSNQEFAAFHSAVRAAGNLIVGKRTYAIMKNYNEFEKCGNPFVVVVSKSLKKAALKNTVIAGSANESLKILQKKGFMRAIVGGGSKIATSFLGDGLVDDIYLDVEPFVFGRGIPLVQKSTLDAKLCLVKVVRLSRNTIRLHYKVLR